MHHEPVDDLSQTYLAIFGAPTARRPDLTWETWAAADHDDDGRPTP